MKPTRIVIASVVLAAGLAAAPPSRPEAKALGRQSIDVLQRQAVIDSYVAEFDRVEPAPKFTGNVSTCTPGTTSTAYQLSVLQRANWFREMAGLPAVAYKPANHAAAQAGALISAAQKSLSHTPATTAKCYTSLGYTGTSSSNLALGEVGVRAINNYIDDFGNNNTYVGHRRWILSPELGGLATGDIPKQSEQSSLGANALFVFGTVAAVTPRDGGVAWPPPGYVPHPVVYDRWSYVRLNADFTNAQVAVVGPNGTVPVLIENRGNFMGAGIVFTPTITSSRTVDTQYTVTITGVAGAPSSTISYNVILVPMNKAPELESLDVGGHRCSGKEIYISPYFKDFESDDLEVEFADTSGDATSFTLNKTQYSGDQWFTLRPKKSVDPLRSTYTFSLRVTDSFGASRVEAITAVIPAPSSKTLCTPRTLAMKRTKAGASVKWTTLPIGAKATRFDVKVGAASCSTAKTTCVLKGLKKGRHRVSVTASRSGSRSVTTSQILILG